MLRRYRRLTRPVSSAIGLMSFACGDFVEDAANSNTVEEFQEGSVFR